MRQFFAFVLILNLACLIKAQTEADRSTAEKPSACYNPNRHLGTCISIYDCISLRYVLEHRLHAFYDFVRASRCNNSVDKMPSTPFVCCTKDINFQETITSRSRSERIIFPDQLDRYRTTKLNRTALTTSAPPTTVEVTTNKFSDIERLYNNDTSTYPHLTNETDSRTATKTKFPKPPNCGGFTFSYKIYGGKTAELGEFSWMVILEYRNLRTGELRMDCSGSIINERYVLTAAHCVQGDILKVNGRLESVRVGEHNTDTEKDCDEVTCRPSFQRFRIESVRPHADYKVKSESGTRHQHDIALLRLEKPLNFDENLQSACLPDVENSKALESGTRFTVSGWGHNGASARTAIKQKVELPFVKHDKCRQIFSKRFYVADEQLCAGGRFREDSCNGDSGGPLMRLCEEYWILEGIVSFGLGCGLERPGIYTNVRHYLNWINDHVEMD